MVVHWWTDLDASFKFSLLLKLCLIIWGTTCGTFTGDHSWGKASEKMYACKIIQDCQCFDSAPNQARANFLNVQQLYLQTMIQVQQFLQTITDDYKCNSFCKRWFHSSWLLDRPFVQDKSLEFLSSFVSSCWLINLNGGHHFCLENLSAFILTPEFHGFLANQSSGGKRKQCSLMSFFLFSWSIES